ncbi:MAG: hypothetical protein R3Y62_08515 [Eubacteriales bacterium]
MDVRAFAATLGAGLLVGAATTMLIPKESKMYQMAEDAAKTVERSVNHAVDDLLG